MSGDWSARELVEAVSANHNWRGILLDGLTQIAEREGQHDLGNALLEIEIDEQIELAALRAASPAARDAYGLRALDWLINDRFFKHYVNLCTIGHDWSVHLTRAFLARVKKDAESSAGAGLAYSRYLSIYAMKMSPACVDDLRALQPEDRQNNPIWARAIKDVVSTLEFRQKMLKEFSR